MKVLIADDSLISRRLLEAALRKWDYEVVVATDGGAAWECLQKEDAPRLAILDWMMPGLSGPDVCRLVRQQAKEHYVYILLVTSKSQKEDLIEGLEAGADDYLTKPFDQNELKVRLGPGRRIVELQAELLKTQAALREQATKDSLTGIWNRHAILETLDRELARTSRGLTSIGLVIGDLDGFKVINDEHGHIVGDAVLRAVAARMHHSMRPYDSLGRYGGEEFLIILPGCDGPAAESQAERMRHELQTLPLELPEGNFTITASFGVTSLPAGTVTGVEAALRVADAALYKAKEAGRNQVVYLSLDQR